MAGFATDTSRERYRVPGPTPAASAASGLLVADHDGVNEPDWTATIDDHPADLTISRQVWIDGITPQDEED